MDEEMEAWTVPNCAESCNCRNVDPNHSTGGPEYHILTVSLSAPWKTWPFVVTIFPPYMNHRRYATAYGRRTDALEHLNKNNHSWAQLPHEWLELIYPMLVASQPLLNEARRKGKHTTCSIQIPGLFDLSSPCFMIIIAIWTILFACTMISNDYHDLQ